MIDYQKLLNPEQWQVVSQGDGPCLVLAGAGSGKTRTLVFRVAYLLEKGVKPENILLMTFTNKAAKQMLSRVENLLGYKPERLWGGTFHHVGNLILRQEAERLGYPRHFNILDQEDSTRLIKHILEETGRGEANKSFPKAGVIQAVLSFVRNSQQDAEEIARDKYGFTAEVSAVIREIADLYDKKKKASSAMDFDDLLVNWLKLLERFPEIRERFSKQFQYILVDEYQDTNYLQAEIIRQLSGVHNNILVVGDDSQSIYSFRAADVNNILNFPKLFNNASVYKIETNYRSTPQILNLANEVIKFNSKQFAKKLVAKRESSCLPTLIPCRDEFQQAAFVVKRIRELRQAGTPYSDLAVLYRSSYQSAELELELNRQNIPYVVRGGLRYFEQAHVKDLVAYLKVFGNFQDELAWKRVLNLYEGIGIKGAEKIWQTLREAGSLKEALECNPKLAGKALEGWGRLRRIFNYLLDLDQKQRGFIAAALQQILELGYEQHLKYVYDNYHDRLEDVRQLINFVATYNDLDKLLSDVMLSESFVGESSDAGSSVVLSTIHQAKGLEWVCVFVLGLADGQFPHYKCLENFSELEEERRLFYVAVTRAKEELNLLYPQKTFHYKFGENENQLSQFMREVDASKYMIQSRPSQWSEDPVIYYD